MELQVHSDNRTASSATRVWCRARVNASRFCIGTMIVLLSSLFALSSLGAQMCHEGVSGAGSAHDASAAPAQRPHHATASPAVHEVDQQQAQTTPALRESSIKSRACCCDEEGRGTSCPSSCPVTGTCSGQGPAAALDRGERDSSQAPVSPAALSAATARPDSWCRSLDTPPPRS